MNESSAAPMDVDDAKSRVDQLLGNLLRNNPATASTRPAKITHRQVSEELVEDTKRRVDRLIRKLGKTGTPAVPPLLLSNHQREESITLNDPLHFLETEVPPQKLRLADVPDTPAGARYRLHNKLVAKRILAANRVRNEFASWKRRHQSRNINNRYVNDLHSDWSSSTRATSVGVDSNLVPPPLPAAIAFPATTPRSKTPPTTTGNSIDEEPQEAATSPNVAV